MSWSSMLLSQPVADHLTILPTDCDHFVLCRFLAGLSGIVSVVFCAMVCGAYCAPNLSPGGLQASRGVYAVLSSCMETFVFVYIGVTLFMEPQQWHCVKFTVSWICAV
jgi:NhaP-type Na+/H+ or K+/H+ antiporter